MPNTEDIALISHLIRRGGFGAPRTEINEHAERGYDATVEWLLDPDSEPEVDTASLYRYHPDAERPFRLANGMEWLYRMVTTQRPLEEKMALFWHQVFATGENKVESVYEIAQQIQMFREHGLGNYRELLLSLAQNPAVLYWLDNQENHKRAPNENWGRELMELFSMGIGNYTEKDVYEASRAFTGWAFDTKIHWLLWGPHLWNYEFHAEDHDATDKTLFGHSGNLDGTDVIDLIVQQPSCHVFIARHLYNFFVADEPQVPAWPIEPPRDPEAIRDICGVFVNSDYNLKPVLRAIFTSDFFKEASFKRVRNPAEVFAGTLRVTGSFPEPHPGWENISLEPSYMGQQLYDPPSVEGWHTGHEWINSGAFVQRVNFMADQLGDASLPGVQDIIRRIASSNGKGMSPDQLVDGCLEQMGPLQVKDSTRRELIDFVQSETDQISWHNGDYEKGADVTCKVLALITGTREYQFG
ncbi:MAG: DUF1800 domain-containing protein [SAR202 cluster bacterium]|nr:DUF1800 domain-containing protein [SAR202 cluster bacterium]